MEENKDIICFPYQNSSCRKDLQSTPDYFILYMFFSLLSALTVFFNLLVIMSISLVKQLHSPTNLLILSLAVSDFLVGLIIMPVNAIIIMETCWFFGKYSCVIFNYFGFLTTSSSIGHLVLISIDRYVAVCDPLSYHSKITMSRILLLICIAWSSSIMYPILLLSNNFSNLELRSVCSHECFIVLHVGWEITDIIISFVSPCSIIIILYFKIFVVALSQSKKMSSRKAVSITFGIKIAQASHSEIKAAKTLAIVIFTYLCCWIPAISAPWTEYTPVIIATMWIMYINSCLNPLIYAFFYPWFKTSVKHILLS